jgi:hypothetical protein
MGVRQVKSSGGNVIGMFPSLKMNEQIPYESTLGRDLLFFLEYDSTVVHYYAQPFAITGSSADGATHTYIPDFQVIRTSVKELVECKPAALLARPHTQQQLSLGQVWAEANDHAFVVITDADLRTGHRLANLKLLWRYSRLRVPPLFIERCRSILIAQPDGLSLEVLSAALSNTSPSFELLPYLYCLLFAHVLLTDLTQPLSLKTCVQLQLPISSF